MDCSYVNQLIDAINGKILYWNNDRVIKYITRSSLQLKKDCLYFVFRNTINEETLIRKLVRYQITGIVIRKSLKINLDKWKTAGIGVIQVPSIHKAYYGGARFYRQQFDIPFIEVIGSSGKTTTKDMIASILKEKMNTLAGFENYNAPSGVAYNICHLREEHQACVLEVGMREKGIMGLSSSMIKPDIAVLTCIHRAHLLKLGSIENIILSKSEILDFLNPNGILIINGDDKNCSKFPLDRFQGKIYRFGFSKQNDIWASDIHYEEGKTYFKANGKDFSINCTINLFGKYNIANALAAILVALLLGLSHEEIVRGLNKFKSPGRRQELLKGIQNSTNVYDNFNANPDSTKLLLSELPHFAGDRPLILVLGDMENPITNDKIYAKRVHYEIGEIASKLNFHYLIAIGQWAKEYINGAKAHGISDEKLIHFNTVADSKEFLTEIVLPNSIIVFKAALAYVDFKELLLKIKL